MKQIHCLLDEHCNDCASDGKCNACQSNYVLESDNKCYYYKIKDCVSGSEEIYCKKCKTNMKINIGVIPNTCVN